MSTNPLALELNEVLERGNPHLMEMLSDVGKKLFFPKGILTQSAEAREKGDAKFNATIGVAMENLHTMHLQSVMSRFNDVRPAEVLKYAPSFGIPKLREVWRELLYEKNPPLAGRSISLPVVSNGITHGISVFADMFVDPGDILIFPDKMWGNNNLIMSVRRDAKIVNYPFFTESGGFNLESFESCIKTHSKDNGKIILFLNFPNNPTGYTINADEADEIKKILIRTADNGTNVIVVTDDAYFGLRYEEDAMAESFFSYVCDCHPRILAVKLDGATKEMFVWGLRVGFITYGTVVEGDSAAFYDALAKKTAGDVRGSISNASHAGQTIVLKALLSPTFNEEREAKVEILKRRAVKLKEILANPKYDDAWSPYPFNSGYFMCLELKTVNAEALRVHILDKYKVGVISTSATDIRIAFSSVDEESLEPLMEHIYQGVKDLE